MEIKILSRQEIISLPDPVAIIEGLIFENTKVVIYGQPGSGKTFIALDMALSISTEKKFLEKSVKGGGVLYLSGEGHAGIKKRIIAWEKHNETKEAERFYLCPDALDLTNEKVVDELIRQISSKKIAPKVIVVDTLAMYMHDADENSSMEMGAFLRGCEKIKKVFKCTILIVHHSGKSAGSGERGSSALRGGADTMLEVTEKAGKITLSCDKQKDAEPSGAIKLQLSVVEGSCVVTFYDSKGGHIDLTDVEKMCLLGLKEHSMRKELIKFNFVTNGSFKRVFDELIDRGFVSRSSRGIYHLTEEGKIEAEKVKKLQS